MKDLDNVREESYVTSTRRVHIEPTGWKKALRSAVVRSTAAAVVVVFILAVSFGLYYLNTSTYLSGQDRTVSSLQSRISSLQNLPLITVTFTTTFLSTTTSTFATTYTSTMTSVRSGTTTLYSTVTSTATMTDTNAVPWNSSLYLSTDPGCSGPGGYTPCFSYNLSEAVQFDCAQEAATPQGCVQTVNSSAPSHLGYVITIWYPYVNQSNEPSWANCAFSVPSDGFDHGPAFCISLSANSFLVTLRAPGPA
jgi:hypothetical protein